MSSSFEEKFEQAVNNGVFPGAILMAKDKSGKYFITSQSVEKLDIRVLKKIHE